MKKRILSLLLVLVLIVGVVPVASASGLEITFNFSVDDPAGGFDGWQPIVGAEVVVYRDGTEDFRVRITHTGTEQRRVPLADTTVFSARVILPSGWDLNYWGGFTLGVPEPPTLTRLPEGRLSVSDFDNGAFFATVRLSWQVVPGETQPPPTFPFTDVPAGEWFTPGIEFVYNEGIMRGITPTMFAPAANFNREMVIATLFRMYHGRTANASDARQSPFADVPADEWFAPYVSWGYRVGLVQGTGAAAFGTGNPVARQDFAVFMYRYANHVGANTDVPGSFTLAFPDADGIGSWAVEPLRWAVYNGLITGTGNLLEPIGTANRAQAATILMRYVEL